MLLVTWSNHLKIVNAATPSQIYPSMLRSASSRSSTWLTSLLDETARIDLLFGPNHWAIVTRYDSVSSMPSMLEVFANQG